MLACDNGWIRWGCATLAIQHQSLLSHTTDTAYLFSFAQSLATQRNRIMHHDAMEVRIQRARDD
jgi:hypothetical protein